MPVSAAVLRELHRLLRQLSEVRSRLERGPRQIQAINAQVLKVQQELDAAKEQVKRSRITADQKELQLREREGRILDIRRKLNSCTTNREYQTLLEQIAADEQANSVLSDEILELFDKIQELQGVAEKVQAQKQKIEHELAALRLRVDEARIALEVELGRLTQDLTAAEQQLPEDLRRDYLRLVNARREEALAPLDGDCCGGCYQTLTPQMINELNLSKPVFCKSCGCILYLPEDRK